jgi:hypothetical protein
MSKPAAIISAAIGVAALAVVIGALALRGERSRPAPSEEQETVETAAPAPRAEAPAPMPPASTAKEVAHRRQPSGRDAGAYPTEASLLAKLHELEETNPPLSLQLAREAVARFPDSPNAPEFEWNVIKALTNLERFGEAQDEARIMVRKYPGTSLTNDIQRHVLSNPQE